MRVAPLNVFVPAFALTVTTLAFNFLAMACAMRLIRASVTELPVCPDVFRLS